MKEKWTKGQLGGTVISDTPNRLGPDTDAIEYYGGYLVAESIPKQEYIDLIAAAPDLYEAAIKALAEMRNTVAPRSSFTNAVDALDAAIAKAKGENHD